MSSTRRVNSIFNSRRTILDLLDVGGYHVEDHKHFSSNEVDAMYANSQLDMILTHAVDGRKAYVKYYLTNKQKQIQKPILDNIIEDLYVLENVLTKRDTLIIIIDDEPNESIMNRITYLYDKDDIFVVIHNMKRLQFNILKHDLVPQMTILNAEESSVFMKEYNVKNITQLPEIGRFDPQALAMCLRPGQICRFERVSPTAMKYSYFRVCV